MDITPNIPQNKNYINSYGIDGFKINEIFYQNTIIIMPEQIIEIKINSIEEFFLHNWKNIFNKYPEILLIGTGTKHINIPSKLKNKFKQQYSITSVSEMTTGSACRTYNILMMENRNIATLLMPIN